MSKATLSGHPAVLSEHAPAPQEKDAVSGMYHDYWILPAVTRETGLVRPVRHAYQHRVCGQVTTMAGPIAETFARDPAFYTDTFCTRCRVHAPLAEFRWADTDEIVGS